MAGQRTVPRMFFREEVGNDENRTFVGEAHLVLVEEAARHREGHKSVGFVDHSILRMRC